MRQYTISKKRRDLGDRLVVRFSPDAMRAMKSLMRDYPERSANTIINTIIETAVAPSPTKPVSP